MRDPLSTSAAFESFPAGREGGGAEAEQQLQRVLEAMPDLALFGTDAQRVVNYWPAAAQRLFKYAAAQIVGVSADILFTPEDRGRGLPKIEADETEARERLSLERWAMRLDGSRFYVGVTATTLRDAAGALQGFLYVVRDLSEPWAMEDRLTTAQRSVQDSLRRRTLERDAAVEELRAANDELRATNDELQGEMAERQHLENIRAEAIRKISSLQEDERRHISRELHDGIGQLMTALQLGLRELETDGQHERPQKLKTLRRLVDTISQEMHRIAVQLRPTALDDLGLREALESLADTCAKQAGFTVDVHVVTPERCRMPSDVEVALFRIVQEALNNVMKHAAARMVSVIVECKDSAVQAIIEDDGRGFVVNPPADDTNKRLGILGMKERAALLGGKLDVESSPGDGTTVYVRIPLWAPDSGESAVS